MVRDCSPWLVTMLKAVQRSEGLLRDFHLHHPRKGRRFGRDVADEGLDCSVPSRHLDFDPVGLIANPAGELVALRQLEDEGSKPHPLDNASNPYHDAPLGRVHTRIQADALLRS